MPSHRLQANSVKHTIVWISLGSSLGLAWYSPVAAGQESKPIARRAVDFNDQVRPILARHCFKCHGPDDKSRKAKLRLDQEAAAKKPASSGEPPIVPGKPDESELVRRVFAEDADERMPPRSANSQLSDAERQTLKRWVAEGAKFDVHWAFRKPVKTAVPNVREPGRVRNPIDAFILARLDQEGLMPSPEADRATLLRRVSLDLVGLPPTPDEVDSFVADRSPDAYEKQVDRLLASPHYGERWARRWLDVARYADTNGYEKDRPRSIWPYRDWVIHALNSNLPFDRFTVEQLAGDMLPGAGVSQKVATGFHRNTMLNEEGGIDPLEFRFYAMTDRVATTGTVWLGLTIGCAQCHTHKFDPIPHRDYYRFMALLNNADEPKMPVPSPTNAERRRSIEARIAAMKADLPNQFPVDEKGEDKDKPPAGSAAMPAERRRANLGKTLSSVASHRTSGDRTVGGARAEESERERPAAFDRAGPVYLRGRRSKQTRCLYRGARIGAQSDHGDPSRGAAGRPAAEPGAGASLLRRAVRRFLSQ